MRAGQLMTIKDACKQAGITKNILNSYISLGYLTTYFDGYLVNYRELLEAAWKVESARLKAKPAPKYKQKKKPIE